MNGLKADGSFVGNGKTVGKRERKENTSAKIFIATVLIIILAISSMVFLLQGTQFKNLGGITATSAYRTVNTDIRKGYKQPTVCFSGYFVVAYYNDSGYLNVTSINSTTGNQVSGFPKTISTDADKYRRTAIATDGAYDLVVWRLNSNGSLYGKFLNTDGSIDSNRSTFQINDSAITVGRTDFDVVGIPRLNMFVVVWSDGGYRNHYRVINDTTPVSMGKVGAISNDTNSHARNQIGYDSTTGNVMFVWRRLNSTEDNTYNTTGRIFNINTSNHTLSPVTDDFTIGDGCAANTQYDYPSIAGGGGYFFVTYTDSKSPYNIYGRVVNANNSSMTQTFEIDSTAASGKSFLGVAYNGTDFVVAWTNSSYDIVARNYDSGGNPTTEIRTIAGTSDSEETQDVAYDSSHKTYYFVWYDYTNGHDYGSLWTESEYIPEFTWILMPVIALLGAFTIRRYLE